MQRIALETIGEQQSIISSHHSDMEEDLEEDLLDEILDFEKSQKTETLGFETQTRSNSTNELRLDSGHKLTTPNSSKNQTASEVDDWFAELEKEWK